MRSKVVIDLAPQPESQVCILDWLLMHCETFEKLFNVSEL